MARCLLAVIAFLTDRDHAYIRHELQYIGDG